MTFALVAAGVGAAGAIGGAVISSNASKNAAATQANAANSASQVQQNEFNTINAENAGNRNLGYGADDLLAQLYGIGNPTAAGAGNYYPGTQGGTTISNAGPTSLPGAVAPGAPAGGAGGGLALPPGATPGGSAGLVGGGGASGAGSLGVGTGTGTGIPNYSPSAGGASAPVGGAAQNPNYSNFYNSPGYQFTLSQGEQAINRNASANGSLYGTQTLGALNNYAQGAASTQYNNYVNQLMSMAGLGQAATNTTSAAATNVGNNISNNTISAGNANASGVLGSASSWNGALNGIQGAVNNSGLVTNPSTNDGNPYNLGGSTPVAPAGSHLTYDANGNITGSSPD